MPDTYFVSKTQAMLPKILRQAENDQRAIGITRRDETVAFLISRERMESLIETMEILADPMAMRAIQKDRAGKIKYSPVSVLDEEQGRGEPPSGCIRGLFGARTSKKTATCLAQIGK